MQFLEISQDMTLSNLSKIVGERNVDSVLNENSLERSVNIGKSFSDRNKEIIAQYGGEVDFQKKLNIINQFVGDSDIFEKAALGTNEDWTTLAHCNCFTDAMKIPSDIQLPSAVGVLGNGESVANRIYNLCTTSIKLENNVDPSIFAPYNASYTSSQTYDANGRLREEQTFEGPFQWFALPFGEIALFSSISQEMLYFPVYPNEFDDGVKANYDEMGEMLYQYEPWKVYKSSGPRELSFTFEFHRDMWTGDHRDGNANYLIRGCEANCYPQFNGSLVHAPIVTLYIHGQNLITGVMTDCKVNWKGPIGLDGFRLLCELSFSITEIAPEPLNYTTVKNKGLIG